MQDIPTSTQPCPAIDKYLNSWLTADTTPIDPTSARIVVGVQSTSIADEARLIDSIRNEIANPPNGMTAAPAGIAALAAQAYDNIVARSLLLNLLPLVVVFLALLAIERNLRRAVLPLLPTAIAAGWAPLILLLLGLLPGNLGKTLGSFNPLTVVLGALVIALATEFGVVLLRRFDEECAKGMHPDDAAAAALAVTGKAIRVSALTLGARLRGAGGERAVPARPAAARRLRPHRAHRPRPGRGRGVRDHAAGGGGDRAGALRARAGGGPTRDPLARTLGGSVPAPSGPPRQR